MPSKGDITSPPMEPPVSSTRPGNTRRFPIRGRDAGATTAAAPNKHSVIGPDNGDEDVADRVAQPGRPEEQKRLEVGSSGGRTSRTSTVIRTAKTTSENALSRWGVAARSTGRWVLRLSVRPAFFSGGRRGSPRPSMGLGAGRLRRPPGLPSRRASSFGRPPTVCSHASGFPYPGSIGQSRSDDPDEREREQQPDAEGRDGAAQPAHGRPVRRLAGVAGSRSDAG